MILKPLLHPLYIIKLLIRNKKQFISFTIADISQLYAGSVLGIFWAIIYPIIQLIIYALLYAVIFKVRPAQMSEYQYTIFVMSGLLPVIYFGLALTGGLVSITNKKNFLLNTILPPELIVLSSILVSQVGPFFGIIVVFVVSILMGLTSPLLIPGLIIMWLILTIGLYGIGLILSLINLVVKDLQHSISLLIMVLTVLSPFAYTEDMVPGSLKFILALNPLTYFIKSFQDIVVWGHYPSANHVLPSCIIAFFLFFIGSAFFRKSKFAFFDNM